MKNNITGKFLLLIAFLAFCGTAFAEKHKYDLSAKDLIADFKDNAVSAGKKYKGSDIRITGKITDIDNTIKMGITGKIKEGEPFVILEDEILIKFKNHKKMNWENLHKGKNISVIGKCKGKPTGDFSNSLNSLFILIEIEKAVLE